MDHWPGFLTSTRPVMATLVFPRQKRDKTGASCPRTPCKRDPETIRSHRGELVVEHRDDGGDRSHLQRRGSSLR